MKAAAAITVLLGGGLIAWLVDKAIRYPEIKAEQAGSQGPLWEPMIAFVAVCVAGAAYLFLHAARRLDRGEDLFAARHRRSRRSLQHPE